MQITLFAARPSEQGQCFLVLKKLSHTSRHRRKVKDLRQTPGYYADFREKGVAFLKEFEKNDPIPARQNEWVEKILKQGALKEKFASFAKAPSLRLATRFDLV